MIKCNLLFTYFSDFHKSLHNEHNKSRAKHKAKYIYAKECGIGKKLVYLGEDWERALKVGADEEHIENLVNAQSREEVICKDVKHESYSAEACKYTRCSREVFEGELFSVSEGEVSAKEDLRAVMHHSLNVDEIKPKEYVAGEDHNAGSGKNAEGCEEHYCRIAKLSFLCKGYDGENVERRGAELEGKEVPVVVPNKVSGCVHINAEKKLLSDLEDDYYYPNSGGKRSYRFVLCVFECRYNKNGEQNCQYCAGDVIWSVALWNVYGGVHNVIKLS